MAYIPYTYVPMNNDGKKKYAFPLDFKGVILSEREGISNTAECYDISNFELSGSSLCVRGREIQKSDKLAFEGGFHSVTTEPFCEMVIIHAGNSLYAYNSLQNTFLLVSAVLPDKKSIMCHFLSKLYIYCDTHVYSLDSSLTLTEEFPDAPLMYDTIPCSSPNPDRIIKGVPYNMIAPVIKVTYGATTLSEFTFPLTCDSSRPIKVWVDDEEVDSSHFTYNENCFRISGLGNEAKRLGVAYFLKNHDDIDFKYDLCNCTLTCAYGGNANGGTRMFFTGNPDFKGRYYKSMLMNPLYVGEDEYEIIGNGCEDITALKKMYGNLMIFTENTVFRMSYNLTDDGAAFSIKELNSGIGCDCPGSVQLIDNRLVFANSRRGIFIIDSTGEADEQNIKPISGNILKGRQRGLLDMDRETLKKSHSIDYDRKYMLLAGDRMYIWNYDRAPFSEYGNYSKAQQKLEWYIYDGIYGDELYNLNGKLTLFDYENVCFYIFEKQSSDIQSSFMKSGRMDFSALTSPKFVTDMEFIISGAAEAEIFLSLYGDGVKYFESSFSPDNGKRSLIKLKLPQKMLYDFGFEIAGKGGFEIEGITVGYKFIKS